MTKRCAAFWYIHLHIPPSWLNSTSLLKMRCARNLVLCHLDLFYPLGLCGQILSLALAVPTGFMTLSSWLSWQSCWRITVNIHRHFCSFRIWAFRRYCYTCACAHCVACSTRFHRIVKEAQWLQARWQQKLCTLQAVRDDEKKSTAECGQFKYWKIWRSRR